MTIKDQSVYQQMTVRVPKVETPFHRRLYPYVILVLTGAYLFLEAAYNIGLVRMLSSSATTRETVEGMEIVGKGLAAIGISLTIVRFLPIWRIQLFLMLSVSLFFAFGILIDRTIQSLPLSMKIAGHYMGLYRLAVVKGDIDDRELGRNGDLPSTVKRIAIANIAPIGFGHIDDIQRKIRGYADIRFRKEVKKSFSNQEFEKLWDDYNKASEGLRPYWERYKGKRLYNGLLFEDNEQGKIAFLNKIKIPEAKIYRETQIYSGNSKYDIPALRTGEIPPFMMRDELRAWINRFVAEGKAKVMQQIAPTESDIGSNRLSDDLSSSVFVPPISMSLSLFSLVLNTISFMAVAATMIISFMMRKRPNLRASVLQMTAFGAIAAALVIPLAQAATPFPAGSEFNHLLERVSKESKVFKVWAMAIKAEEVAYTAVSNIPGVVALGDRLPGIGQNFAPSPRTIDGLEM